MPSVSKGVFLENLSNENELIVFFFFYESEPVGPTLFYMNGFA